MGFLEQAKRVLLDRRSGSTTITLGLLGLMARAKPGVDEALAALRLAERRGRQMVVLWNTARVCGRLIEAGVSPAEAAVKVSEWLRSSVEMCGEVGGRLLSGYTSILTLSNSEQLQEIIGRAEVETVYVLESRPGGEGVILARRLRSLGKKAVVAPDLSAHILTARCGCVVVGTDALYPDGFTNKLGSGLLAQLAAHHSKPFYAATVKWKVHPPGKKRAGSGYASVFEQVEGSLVTGYITELGVLGPSEAHRSLARSLEEQH